jgi:hypothetical protein
LRKTSDLFSPYLKEKHQGHLISWNDWAIEVSLNSARGCQMVEKDKVSPYLKEKHQGHLISWNDWAIEPWGNDPRPVLESYQIPHRERSSLEGGHLLTAPVLSPPERKVPRFILQLRGNSEPNRRRILKGHKLNRRCVGVHVYSSCCS